MSQRAAAVSAVVPAFNVGPWLADAVMSLRDQDPPPAEVIVVDDGSRDDTVEAAEAIDGVTVVRRPHRGASAARNAGADRSHEDLVLFLDADDTLEAGGLATMEEALRRHPGAVVVIANYRTDDGKLGWPDAGERLLSRDDVGGLIADHRLTANSLVRKDIWRHYRFDEGLRAAEDQDLWVRMLLDGHRLVVLSRPVIRKRVRRPGSLTADIVEMRRARRAALGRTWRSHLFLRERTLLAWRWLRATVGIAVAITQRAILHNRSSRYRPAGISAIIHVWFQDGGGGPRHAELLLEQAAADPPAVGEPLPAAAAGSPVAVIAACIRLVGRIPPRAIVHAHGLRAAALAWPAVVCRRARFIVTLHGVHAVRQRRSRVLTASRILLRRADRVLVLTISDLKAVMAHRLAMPDRVQAIRQGVARPDTRVDRLEARRRLGFANEEIVCAWIGRLSEEKDPMTFVNAARLLDAPRINSIIAGDGPMRHDLLSRTEASSSAATMLGWVDDVNALLAASDIVVNTSHWEGMSLAVLEAAAAARALILTDVPGNRDVVDAGIPAVLVPSRDPAALAAAITALADDPERRVQMGRRAAEVVRQEFSADRLTDSVFDAYQALT